MSAEKRWTVDGSGAVRFAVGTNESASAEVTGFFKWADRDAAYDSLVALVERDAKVRAIVGELRGSPMGDIDAVHRIAALFTEADQ